MNANCKTLVLPLALLLAGLVSTQVAAQEYKEDYNAALAAAKAQQYPEARAKFPASAEGADEAGDDGISRQARSVAAKIDYKLGNAALKGDNFEQALGYYQAGTAIFPAYIKNRYGQGLALKKMGRMEEALGAFREVSEASGDRKTSLAAAKAIREHFYFQASSAVSRTNPTALDADRAFAALTSLEEYNLDPDANYHYYQAEAHRIKGDASASAAAADEALALHNGSKSDKAKIWFVKAQALVSLGDVDAAKAAFTNADFGSYRQLVKHYLETL